MMTFYSDAVLSGKNCSSLPRDVRDSSAAVPIGRVLKRWSIVPVITKGSENSTQPNNAISRNTE